MVKSSQQKEKLHQLYALYEQPLYRIAYAILHQTEQAEDAVSDAFLKIIPHLDQIESPDSPKTKAFLIQVIRNTAINQYRKNAKDAERLTSIDDSTLQVPSPHNEVEQFLQQTEQQEQLAQLLQGLSETDRTILFLRCEQEQSFREIAEQLSMKEATVRKRFERTRKAIQKQDAERLTSIDDSTLQVPSPHNEVEQFLQQTEQQEQLAQLLQGLSETDRTILFLRCEQEQSFREIAERLSMKEATVRKRFERARKAIQKQEERGISYVKKCSIQP